MASDSPTLLADLLHAADLAHFAAVHAGTLPSAAEARFRAAHARLREEMERRDLHLYDTAAVLHRINGGPIEKGGAE